MVGRQPVVTLLSTADAGAGGYIAARRLLDALMQHDVQARMLVLHKRTDHAAVQAIGGGWAHEAQTKIKLAAEVGLLLPDLKKYSDAFQFATAQFGVDIANHPWVREADVLHLHWINQGFLSLNGLQRLATLGKPVVWTLHDQWAFTGGCHYSGDCTRFETGCGHCPYLRGDAQQDLSRTLLLRKETIWAKLQPHVVTCSDWLAGLASRSRLLQSHAVSSIPNPIDTNTFKPIDKSVARRAFGLPADKRLVLFGATKLADPRKGAALFAQAVSQLAQQADAPPFEVVIFGNQTEPLSIAAGVRIHVLGRVNNEARMAQLYAAADVFVSAAVQDNLPNTILEAQACGTPVAAFAVGGVPQLVAHQHTGHLATETNPKALAQSLRWLFSDANTLAILSEQASARAHQIFGNTVVAACYAALYKQLLSGKA